MARRATPGDAELIAKVHVASWQDAYRDLLPDEFLATLDVERRREWWSEAIDGERMDILVVEDEDTVVGFCSSGPAQDHGRGEVYAIYVHPDSWGSGFGLELLAAAEAALWERGFRTAILWVLKRNERARLFYERQGWSVGKPFRIEKIGGVDVTEVRYEKRLQSP